MRAGMPSSAPATAAETAKTIRIGRYSTSGSRGRNVPLGMIRGANEWPGLDMGEAHGAPQLAELRELIGRVVPRHRQVLDRGSEILPEREAIDVRLPQVAHGLQELWTLLAQPKDDPRLGQELRRRAPRAAEELERALVAAAVTRDLVEARHGLGIVVQDIGPGGDHGLEGGGAALQVRDQELDAAARRLAADGPHRGGKDARAAVG